VARWLALVVALAACNDAPQMHWAPVPVVPVVPIASSPPVHVPVPVPVPVPGSGASANGAPLLSAQAAPATVGHWPVPPWLCAEDVAAVVRNRGGSSITFRMRMASGGKLAFKPDQVAGYSRFRAELAAYRLSERLGYGRVPPSCERAFGSGVLANAGGADEEFVQRLTKELRVGPGGRVRGAAILWVDGIRPVELFPGQILGHALQTPLSDMVLFDELCGNWDRWSGGNVFTDAAGQALVLIDNAAGFGPIGEERRAKMDRVLDRAVSPSPGMLAALGRLTRQDVAAALAGIYGDEVVDAVMSRRDRLLARRASATATAR
jgi:hypothetical protein